MNTVGLVIYSFNFQAHFLSLNLHSAEAHVSVFPNSTFSSSHCGYFALCIWRRTVCLILVLFFKKQIGNNDVRLPGQEHGQWNYNQA